jgi:outer membrane protein TolC
MNPTLPSRHPACLRRPLAILIATMALGGCASLQPEPLKLAKLQEAVQADRDRHTKDIEPLAGMLTLEEAIARAIKYNADRRMKAMEQAVAEGALDVANYDILPKLVASAGYRDRDSDLITRSKDSITGAPSLANPFISSSRTATTADLTFSWSLLDFGQSYYAAKQNADRVLIANERKRKALHLLVQDVRTAYWRVVAAQSLGGNVRNAIKEAEFALQDARKAEGERLRNPLEPLRFQRQLLENIRLLEAVEQELSTASTELAALVSLPLNQAIKVSLPTVDLQRAWLDKPISRLEEQALARNADISEGFYNSRIAREETRRAMLKLFPGISFNYGSKHSDDEYLINKSWQETGAQISFNLFGLLSAPSQMKLADAGVALADQKRLVTQMAVLTQLHVARLQFANTLRQYERADAIADVEARLANHVANQADAEKQTKLDRVSQQTSLILAQLRRFQALSNTHAAASKLQATLGMEPVVEAKGTDTLGDLVAAVSKALKLWESGTLPEPAFASTAKE